MDLNFSLKYASAAFKQKNVFRYMLITHSRSYIVQMNHVFMACFFLPMINVLTTFAKLRLDVMIRKLNYINRISPAIFFTR